MTTISLCARTFRALFKGFDSNSNRPRSRSSRHALQLLAILALGTASTSFAQPSTPIDPYVKQKCVTDNVNSYGTNYYGDCAISPLTNVVTPPFYWSVGTDGSVATNSDGSLIFIGAVEAIHVFKRDTTTGDITYQGCVSDRGSSGTGYGAPPDCAGLASYYSSTVYNGQFAGTGADWNIGYQSGDGVYRMSVLGDDLYAATQHRLLHFKIVAGASGSPTTLSFHACWRSVSDPSAPFGTDLDSCQVVQTPDMSQNGHLMFQTMAGPAASPDGNSIYATITYFPNIDSSSVVQADSHISAVLHFGRDSGSGELTYQGCAGQLVERIDTGGSPSTFVDHDCGYGNLYGFRNAGPFGALSVTPDGNSLVVAGMGGDLTTCPDPSSASECRPWAVALLTRGTETGALSNQQCILVPSGNPCSGVSSPYDNGANGTSSATVNPFNVTFAPSNSEGLSDIYLETNAYTTGLDPTAFILHPDSGSYTLVSTPGNTSDNRLAGSLYDHLFQVAPKNGQLFAIQKPNNGSLGDQFEIFHPDASNQGLLSYVDCAAGPNSLWSGGTTNCTNRTVFPENLNVRQMAFTPDGGTFFTMGNYVAGFVTGPPQTLTVNSDHGTVTSSPVGINCQTTTGCTADFPQNTNVQLSAVGAAGYVFSSWSGDCSGTSVTCNVTMSAAKTVTANYTAVTTYTLTVDSVNGTVTSDVGGIDCPTSKCSVDFNSGTTVQLTASPDPGYVFSSWSGGCTGSTNPCSLTMSAAKTVTANFTATPQAPPTPANFKAWLTTSSIRKKVTYTGNLTWTESTTLPVTGFKIQRYVNTKVKGKTSCVQDARFSATVAGDQTGYQDTSATSSVCGYGVAATNSVGTSDYATDFDMTTP